MGKAKRQKRLRGQKCMDMEDRFVSLLTKNFQQEIRNSEIWDQMVAEFGEEKATQILKGCKADIVPGEDI
jgi:hypothetical protein